MIDQAMSPLRRRMIEDDPIARSYRVRLISSRSFRDASKARGPGIQIQTRNWCLDSGFAPSARPGMTESFIRIWYHTEDSTTLHPRRQGFE